MNNEMRQGRDEVARAREVTERTVAQHRANWAEEKLNFQKRVDELEVQYSHTNNKLTQVTAAHKKVIHI